MKVAEALRAAPETLCPQMEAIITKVSEPKAYTDKQGRPGTRIPVTLADETGEIKFTYFNPPKTPELNDVVVITNAVIQAGYVAGSGNEMILRRYPPPAGTITTRGKGSLPQAPAPVPQSSPYGQVPNANTFFGGQPAPQQQPIYQPAPQQQPVYQPLPQQPAFQPQAPAPAFQPSTSFPVQAPTIDPQGADPGLPDQTQAILAIGEYMIQHSEALTQGLTQICNVLTQSFTNMQNALINSTAQLSNGLQAIWEELNHAGVDIDSKFDQVYLRLLQMGKKPVEIFEALSKKAKDMEGLGDHKTAIIALSSDWNIDISDIV